MYPSDKQLKRDLANAVWNAISHSTIGPHLIYDKLEITRLSNLETIIKIRPKGNGGPRHFVVKLSEMM